MTEVSVLTLFFTFFKIGLFTFGGGYAMLPFIQQEVLHNSWIDEATFVNFVGISVEDCAQYKVAICAEGMRADEVWLIEAKDDAALETLKALAETRIEAKLEETVTYAPDQYVVVEKAQILVNGRYLALFISPDVDALKAGFEAAFQ